MDLYRFIAKKLKIKSASLHDLAIHCGCSKSTLYRILKGTQPFPEPTQQKIAAFFSFTSPEETQFELLCRNSNADDALRYSQKSIQHFLHGDHNFQEFAFIFYHHDKFFRTFEEMLAMLMQEMNFVGHINMRIINCLEPGLFSQLSRTLSKANPSIVIQVDHVFALEETNHMLLPLLDCIWPVLGHSSYENQYYIANSSGCALLQDSILLECSSFEDPSLSASYLFASLPGGFAQCHQITDNDLFSFFRKQFYAQKSLCTYQLEYDVLSSLPENPSSSDFSCSRTGLAAYLYPQSFVIQNHSFFCQFTEKSLLEAFQNYFESTSNETLLI